MANKTKKVYIGKTKPEFGLSERIFLYDFEWSCNWYWSGGYIGNKNIHCHFDGCFLNVPDVRGHPLGNFVTPWNKTENSIVIQNGCSVWEDVSTFLDDAAFDKNQWYRIKDLFKQFYTLKSAAEVFLYGGHISSEDRSEKEINPEMARTINLHIQDVIIPEIRTIVKFEGEHPVMNKQ